MAWDDPYVFDCSIGYTGESVIEQLTVPIPDEIVEALEELKALELVFAEKREQARRRKAS